MGIALGNNDASGGHHHIISRAKLPGSKNRAKLWAHSNIALSCRSHHEKFGHAPVVWALAMIELGYATREDYEWLAPKETRK